MQPLRGGRVQPVRRRRLQPVRGRGVQPLCGGGLLPVQSVRGGLQPVQPLRGGLSARTVAGAPRVRISEAGAGASRARRLYSRGPISMLHFLSRSLRPFAVALAFAAVAVASPPGEAQDLANGEKVWKKCKACHTLEEGGKNKIGPNLFGVIGAPAGMVEGFKYSKAFLEAGLTWDDATLTAWLADPKDVVKGSKMAFPGLKDPADIADVIAYMASEGG